MFYALVCPLYTLMFDYQILRILVALLSGLNLLNSSLELPEKSSNSPGTFYLPSSWNSIRQKEGRPWEQGGTLFLSFDRQTLRTLVDFLCSCQLSCTFCTSHLNHARLTILQNALVDCYALSLISSVHSSGD